MQVVTPPRRDATMAAASTGPSSSAAADLSGFGDAEDILRVMGSGGGGGGSGFGRRNIYSGGSGYDY